MPTELTVFQNGRPIGHEKMSDQAFLQAVEAGWKEGEAVSAGEPGYFFLICLMREPRWNAAGTVQIADGQVTVERHRVS